LFCLRQLVRHHGLAPFMVVSPAGAILLVAPDRGPVAKTNALHVS